MIKDILKGKIIEFFNKEGIFHNFQIKRKLDNSLVTEIDIQICKIVKAELLKLKKFDEYGYFSEEDHGDLKFPAVVLDPIDGTSSLVRNFPECAISLAIMKSDKIVEGWGWIFNPFTGFDLSTEHYFFKARNSYQDKLIGLVSRSEWEKGTFRRVKEENLSLSPKGSIAFKLGLLAAGGADFVLTRRNKHIWDIAAGSILCASRDIFLFTKENELLSLEKEVLQRPMLWCKREHFSRLKFLLED